MVKLLVPLACLGATILPSPAARATGWELWASGADDLTLISVCSPNVKDVFAAGVLFDSSGTIPTMSPRVFASADAGKTFTDITGSLSGQAFTALEAVSFLDEKRGWVGGGAGKVWATADRGAHWTTGTSIGLSSVHALHFFDAKHGVAVGEAASAPAVYFTGDGGNTWTASALPAVAGSADYTFWLDEKVGWLAGASTKSVDDGSGNTYDAPDQGFVLSTTDGGATWTLSNLIADYALGPVHFLRDGQTGWVAGYKLQDADHAEAALYSTTDGGKTWVDAKLPLDVGKLTMMSYTFPLPTSFIRAIFFSDAKTGHLGGNAYIGNEQSGQGQPTKVFRTVDYWTQDGGATWQRTDLGTINFGSGSITNDGTLAGGFMVSVNQGWMAGTKGSVWGYDPANPVACQTDGECAPGFGCSIFHKCQSVTCPDGCPAGTSCSWAQCRMPPDAGLDSADGSAAPVYDDAGNLVVPAADGGAAPVYDDAGHLIVPATDGGAISAADAGTGAHPGGCGCAATRGSASAVALAFIAWALWRRPRIAS